MLQLRNKVPQEPSQETFQDLQQESGPSGGFLVGLERCLDSISAQRAL